MADFKTALLAVWVAFVTAFPTASSPIKCPTTLWGGVPENFSLSAFDTNASPFSPKYTKGQNLTWSSILRLPDVDPSRFDLPSDKAIEVTINDSSIFLPGGGKPQIGFRRAGLLMGNGSDVSNVGVQTFHWSVRQDREMRMNLTHEYMNVWHEANDYQSNQFSINAGIMLVQDKPKVGNVSTTGLDKNLWKILNRNNDVVWTMEIEWDDWQNFAITLDYGNNTLQVYYSSGYEPLAAVTKALPNDNSGGGQYQIGIAKKPTETVSVVYDGFQESNLHEGQIYGGIFIEDSSGGCIST
ncbi:hypothetical protein EG329_001840 [Mollisiaceae sp. DMI_Dod_QoI]|nr:hypothetical protein EG329_001840 [Helotiales sp. DMI_Dod_QoI]